MKNKFKNATGFTLVELMVTLVVAAILLSIGMPSFTEFIRDNKTVSETSRLVRDLNFTRSEAVQRGVPVSLCRGTVAGCGNNPWEDGWIVFTNINRNNALDGADAVIQVNEGLDANFTLRAGGNIVTYLPSGNLLSGADTFKVCRPDQDTARSRAVDISVTGRISVSTVAAGGLTCP